MKADPKGTLAKVGEIGYHYVEAADYKDGKFYGMEPAEFKAEVEKDGMILLSSHASQRLPIHPIGRRLWNGGTTASMLMSQLV